MMNLQAKVALITGAGSGIGAATARLMVAAGARVVLTGIPASGVEAVASELNAHQPAPVALAIPLDVAQPAQVAAAVAQTVAHFGQLDLVVASAGIQLHRQDLNLHELDDEVWDRTHAVNYRGVYLTCKHSLTQMVKQGTGGAIVIVSSVTALNGRSPNVAYLSGKHGLIGLTRHIGVHYAQHNIRCNAVCPGALEQTPNHDEHPNPAGRAETLHQRIPLARLGRPEDIAPVITFLCTDDAAYATGATFVIDGGLSIA